MSDVAGREGDVAFLPLPWVSVCPWVQTHHLTTPWYVCGYMCMCVWYVSPSASCVVLWVLVLTA